MGHEQDVRCGQAAARTPVGARRQTRPHPGPLADGLRLVVVGGSPCSPCAAGARQICEMPLQAAFAARRSQKSSKRPLSRQQRRAMMALPPARLKQRTRRQSPSLGRRRSRRFPRLGNGRAGRPEPVADAPSAPSVPTSPCPLFGKAKRAVIRLPTSVHDDRICCSTSPHWGVQDPPDCALVRRSGASVRRWSRNRNLRPAIAQLRHLPISRAWPTFPRLDPQRPHLLDAPANLRLPPHGHLVLTCSK